MCLPCIVCTKYDIIILLLAFSTHLSILRFYISSLQAIGGACGYKGAGAHTGCPGGVGGVGRIRVEWVEGNEVTFKDGAVTPVPSVAERSVSVEAVKTETHVSHKKRKLK